MHVWAPSTVYTTLLHATKRKQLVVLTRCLIHVHQQYHQQLLRSTRWLLLLSTTACSMQHFWSELFISVLLIAAILWIFKLTLLQWLRALSSLKVLAQQCRGALHRLPKTAMVASRTRQQPIDESSVRGLQSSTPRAN